MPRPWRGRIRRVRRGFSLVELLVVAAIILILAGIMSVNYFLARQKTQESVDSANKYTKDANDIIHASYE